MSPLATPVRSARRLVRAAREVAVAVVQDDVLVNASAMAFSLFLASIPLMALAGSVVARVLSGEPRALSLLSSIVDAAPDEVRALVDRHVERGTDQAMAPLFLLGALWLAATAFHDAMTVFESALDAERRSWFQKRLIAIACVLVVLGALVGAGLLAVSLAGGAFALVRSVVDRAEEASPHLVAGGAAAVVAWLLVAAFFRIAVRHRKLRPTVWPGATATVVIGTLASLGFAGYARTLASYAVFYGSLAAVAVFLLWLWIGCIAVLIGVELNARLERGD